MHPGSVLAFQCPRPTARPAGWRMWPRHLLLAAATALGTAGAAWAEGVPSPLAPASARPSFNFYGLPGLMDMPTAHALPDGEVALAFSHFGDITRLALSAQVLPRLSANFRYNRFEDLFLGGYEDYYDRGFDIRFQLAHEGRWHPGLALGLQDFAGTGLQSAEYLAATRTVGPGLTVTAGLGWGRLGTRNPLGELKPDTRTPREPTIGGTFTPGDWFGGPFAVFGGIEWRPTRRLGVKLEYSSDAYVFEAGRRGLFEVASPFNFGLEYQAAPNLRLGAYAMHGDRIGFSAALSMNPMRPVAPRALAPAAPIPARGPAPGPAPGAAGPWPTTWTVEESTTTALRDALERGLGVEGQRLAGVRLTGDTAHVWVTNGRHSGPAAATGRSMRVMARLLPPSVERLHVTQLSNGLPLSTVTLMRSDLERLETEPDRAAALLARARIARGARLEREARLPGYYPRVTWRFGPSFRTSYFDPDQPLRHEVAARAALGIAVSPSLSFGGALTRSLNGNLDQARVAPIAGVPAARTDWPLYYSQDDLRLNALSATWADRIAGDVYGRVSAGYLERMFAGVSAELLWKPVDNRLALGLTANHATKRDPDRLFGLDAYSVVTGHLSAYYETDRGYFGQIDVGRYLAGDIGATVTLKRRFSNGWEVGAFATLTDMPAEQFGEGSFDKGVTIRIPLNWSTGHPSRRAIARTIRPVQRDGGARLGVPGRLYERVRDADRQRHEDGWPLIWR